MASNEIEIQDPAATVEMLKNIAPARALNRRHFVAALGLTGAATGAALMSSPAAFAQQPVGAHFAQSDYLNFLLNIKYLQATFYSYLTQGTDLPPALTISSGSVNDIPGTQITNANPGVVSGTPTRIALTGTNAAQITDLLNEIYYDELNQVIDLRNLIGSIVVNRPNLNLLGTGPLPASTAATYTLAPLQALAIARMLEDVSVTALTGLATFLSGSNLAFAAQILAADSFHAGALRLVAIQTGAPYQSTQFVTPFTGSTTTGNPIVYAAVGSLGLPVVGSAVSGIGIPAGALVTANSITSTSPSGVTSIAPTGFVTKTNLITGVSSVAGLAIGQPITGGNIPPNTVITGVTSSPNTITISQVATGVTQVVPTGYVTSGSKTITTVSSTAGVIVGQPITGAGILPGTTVTALSSSAATITMSLAANATSQVTPSPTGITTSGSAVLTAVSSVTGVTAGLPISGTGIPATTTVVSVTTTAPFTITMSAAATATITKAETLTVAVTEIVTTPTTEVITIATGNITISANATTTGFAVIEAITADPMDVYPADPGTAAAAAAGPALIPNPLATPGITAPTYQGFFDTSGSVTASGSVPAGFAFTRTTSQVLAILYNTTTAGIGSGGFFPSGIAGTLNIV